MLKDGVYSATVGGHVSVVQLGSKSIEIEFPVGVRGIGIKDVITVNDGKISSKVLGPNGEINPNAYQL